MGALQDECENRERARGGTSREPSQVARGASDEQVGDDATDGCDGEESQAEPAGNDACQQGDDSRQGSGCGQHHVGKGHDGQRDVGDIVKEAAHETMADGALDESHGNHPDEVGENDGQEDVDKKAMLLHRRRS